MSGGHFDYMYSKIEWTYEGQMRDHEMNVFLKDFCKLLRSLEWFESGDTCEEDYAKDLANFKKKWFKGDKRSILSAKSDMIKELKKYIEKLEEEGFIKED